MTAYHRARQLWTSLRGRIINTWSGHIWIDYALGLFSAGIVFIGLGYKPWIQTGADGDSGTFIGIAQVIGIIVAFSVSALLFYFSAGGDRVRSLATRHGDVFLRSWVGAVRQPLIVVGVLVFLARFADTGLSSVVSVGVDWLLASCMFRVGRTIWLFKEILEIQHLDQTGPAPRKAPAIKIVQEDAD